MSNGQPTANSFPPNSSGLTWAHGHFGARYMRPPLRFARPVVPQPAACSTSNTSTNSLLYSRFILNRIQRKVNKIGVIKTNPPHLTRFIYEAILEKCAHAIHQNLTSKKRCNLVSISNILASYGFTTRISMSPKFVYSKQIPYLCLRICLFSSVGRAAHS